MKITHKGTTYTLDGEYLLDEDKCIVDSQEIKNNVITGFVDTLDLKTIDKSMLYDLIFAAKKNHVNNLSIKLIRGYIVRKDVTPNEIKNVCSILTGAYRQQGHPEKAVEAYEYFLKKYGTRILSTYLIVSVASAYADMHEYTQAMELCRKGQHLEGGHDNIAIEQVIERIHLELWQGSK